MAELAEFATEEVRREIWSHDTELLARTVELLNQILAVLTRGGVLVIPVKQGSKLGKPWRIERPAWIKTESSEKVMRPRDFFAAMRKQN